MFRLISQNPYRSLGVLSNSQLKERVGNQNRLAAFSKIGRDVSFPYDFTNIIGEKPIRSKESITAATAAINLDKDQLKHAFFWFINSNPIDEIALKYLQVGNQTKAIEILSKKQTYSSFINLAVLALIRDDVPTAFYNISSVVHNESMRSGFLQALRLQNLSVSEDDMTEMVIQEMLKEIPAKTLFSVATNKAERNLISQSALTKPISFINAAVAAAAGVDPEDAEANFVAGKKLMDSTKDALREIQDIAGKSSPQYALAADSLAKQILQCGINYFNHARESDVESPRRAMQLQRYALEIAVGQLVKNRCQENCDTVQNAIDSMPPASVATETRNVREELRKFCELPDEISHSITLLRNTEPYLQTIKTRLGNGHAFYLELSTQVVQNALFNVIAEVNLRQELLSIILKAAKDAGIDRRNADALGELSPHQIFEKDVKPTFQHAMEAFVIMDTFDMRADFKKDRYDPNRKRMIDTCAQLGISTPLTRDLVSSKTKTAPSKSGDEGGCFLPAIAMIVGGIIGANMGGIPGMFIGAFVCAFFSLSFSKKQK